jgi:Holliday junction resolvase-like predicted endonuclease
MSGRYSRNKGARVERELVKMLNDAGFTALRVPLSGAAKGFEYDVIAAKDGRNFSFEVKARGTGFESVYEFYNREAKDGVMAYEGDNNSLFYASTDIKKLINLKDCVAIHRDHQGTKDRRVIDKIHRMQALTKGANFLAIKGDRMGFIFIRYFA